MIANLTAGQTFKLPVKTAEKPRFINEGGGPIRFARTAAAAPTGLLILPGGGYEFDQDLAAAGWPAVHIYAVEATSVSYDVEG